jgi:hypothetical protein
MSKSDGGKGSSPRPFSVSNEEYAKRWEAIFGREDVEKIVKDAEKYLKEQKRTTQSIERLEKSLKENTNER